MGPLGAVAKMMTGRGACVAALALGLGFCWGFASSHCSSFPANYIRAAYWSIADPVRPRDAAGFDFVTPTTDIVFVGDSITRGGLWHDIFRGQSVAVRAQSGQTIQEILQWSDAVVALRPKLVFVMGGINDLSRGTAPEQIVRAYGELVDRYVLAGARVVVQSTVESAEGSQGPTVESVRELNRRLFAAMENRAGVEWLDINDALSDDRGLRRDYTTDGIHLNGVGYQAWYGMVRPVVAAFQSPQDPTGASEILRLTSGAVVDFR